MKNFITTAIATPPATRFCMSALLGSGVGSSLKGRYMVADIAGTTAVRVPASLEDVAPGVRAWSPPV